MTLYIIQCIYMIIFFHLGGFWLASGTRQQYHSSNAGPSLGYTLLDWCSSPGNIRGSAVVFHAGLPRAKSNALKYVLNPDEDVLEFGRKGYLEKIRGEVQSNFSSVFGIHLQLGSPARTKFITNRALLVNADNFFPLLFIKQLLLDLQLLHLLLLQMLLVLL